MIKHISFSLVLLAAGTVQVADARESDEGRWSTTIRIGTELLPHGTFQGRHTGTIANVGAFIPSLAGRSGVSQLDSLTYDDLFRVGPSADVELGYRFTNKLEPFARLSYSQLRGEKHAHIGEVFVDGQSRPSSVRAKVDDMNSWAFNVGARYFFAESGPLNAFVAGNIGVNRADKLHGHVRIDNALAPASRRTLLRDETRFNAGVEVGVSYELAERTELRFSVGADYRNARHEQSHAYEGLGINPVRVTDQQWFLPIDLGLNIKF